MRPSKLNYYSDFVVYPVVIVGLAAVGVAHASWTDRTEWLCVGVAGFLLWTLVEYLLHRYVLHEQTYFAPMHGQHHASPLSFIGTPPWISVFVLCGTLLVPIWWCVGFNVADGVTVGVMVGYWWYGVVHHMIHHHAHDSSSPYFNDLRAWHMRHHYSPKRGNFGVTTPLWDRVFGTVIHARDKPVMSS
jgi:sterol desaturase/sphingolipid hydroxylase (fatty acid hydroxylase superfamily)